MKGCRKRRRKSQKVLYEMFYGYGMSISLRYSDSREEAAEILNDAFMKVFENIQTFNSEKNFKPWLRKIVINTAINRYHKNKKHLEMMELNLNENHTGKQETITGNISYDEIVKMVQELSPAYRTVFNLYVIDGFSHKEIARQLDIAVGTSKSNLSKAKSNLRTLLEQKFKVEKHDV